MGHSLSLKGRVIALTGGARGLGKELTTMLTSCGATVAVIDLEKTELGATSFTVDITNGEAVDDCFIKIGKQFSVLDVLINNASNYSTISRGAFQNISTERWNRTFDINVTGAFNCCRAALPLLKTSGNGKIINITSDAALKGLPDALDYVTSKGALISFTRALARELGEFNISVNAIAPGYMKHEDAPTWSEERDIIVCNQRSLKKTHTPEDLFGAVRFFSSDASHFVTGQTLVVDGGEVFL